MNEMTTPNNAEKPLSPDEKFMKLRRSTQGLARERAGLVELTEEQSDPVPQTQQERTVDHLIKFGHDIQGINRKDLSPESVRGKKLEEIHREGSRLFIEANRAEYTALGQEARAGNPQPTSIKAFNKRCHLAGLQAVADDAVAGRDEEIAELRTSREKQARLCEEALEAKDRLSLRLDAETELSDDLRKQQETLRTQLKAFAAKAIDLGNKVLELIEKIKDQNQRLMNEMAENSRLTEEIATLRGALERIAAMHMTYGNRLVHAKAIAAEALASVKSG